MNMDIAQIALMFVLPLGITFVTILQSAAAEYRYQKITGAMFSLIVVAMDCLFYFTKNSFIAYNTDGGMLLAFASMFFLALLYMTLSELRPAKVANGILAALMLAAFIGIAYWDRPTLVIKSGYSPAEMAEQNARYQDYISSFQNGEGGKWKTAPKQQASAGTAVAAGGQKPALSEGTKDRLSKYAEETAKVIERMNAVIASMEAYEPLPSNISDAERETRGNQALAINNNAMAINKKVLGLFHPHESSEVHAELIQATESLRLATYSLYTYALQENPNEQIAQYKQSRSQIAQTKISLERFSIGIQNLTSNNQTQTIEQ